MVKFITVTNAYGKKKTIAIDNIASIEASGISGSTITLKEVKNGNNVQFLCIESPTSLRKLVSDLSGS